MMDEIGVLLHGLDLFERWSKRQSKEKTKNDPQREEAIRSLLTAISETSAYMADRIEGAKINRKREMKLSALWIDASMKVRFVDRRLSRLLALKSMGWADPDLWNDPEFKKFPLQLEIIRKQCMWLIEHDR